MRIPDLIERRISHRLGSRGKAGVLAALYLERVKRGFVDFFFVDLEGRVTRIDSYASIDRLTHQRSITAVTESSGELSGLSG